MATAADLQNIASYPANHFRQIADISLAGVSFSPLCATSTGFSGTYDGNGYAIDGLAVGETAAEMYETIEQVEEYMPKDKPRYLMGVGTPGNIIEGVYRGVDFFDCVMPARNGRHGHLYTWEGVINIKNKKYERDDGPIAAGCNCPVCRSYSRSYLRHLFKAEEILAMRFAVAHNLYFYNDLMSRIRSALEEGNFGAFREKYAEILDSRI